LITKDDYLCISDFDIAETIGALPRDGVRGTQGYMSYLRQAGAPVEPSMDLFGMSLVLFECIAGISGPGRKTPMRSLDDAVPRPLLAAINDGLAGRFRDVGELATAVARAVDICGLAAYSAGATRGNWL
jgi:hypothetical protein